MAKDEVEVYTEERRRYLIAKTTASFDRGTKAVEKAKGGKFRVPALHINEQAREERGYGDDICRNGNWVKDGILHRQDKRVITPTGLCYLHADKAVQAHGENREDTLEGCTQDEIDRAEAEGLEIKETDLDEDGSLVIPCTDFGSNRYGLFLFGGRGTDKERSDRARNSGEWLINAPEKIKKITLYLDDKDYFRKVGKDHATPMWFGSLDSMSVLYGCRFWHRGLRCDNRVLGIFDSAEGAVASERDCANFDQRQCN